MSEPTAFPPTANPGAYVPWRGSECALAGLERWAFETKNVACALTGRAGMGKTLLLKLFAARARLRFRTAFVSYPDCDPDDLCRVVVHELGGVGGDDPQAALAGVLREPGAREVMLLIDEAQLLPPPTARWIRELAGRSAGALRVLLAVTRDEQNAMPVMIGDAECATVRIEGSMSQGEVKARVRAELERAKLEPALRAYFDDTALAGLFARSEGVPAAVQSLAAALLYEAQRPRRLPRQTPALDEAHPAPAAARAARATAEPPSLEVAAAPRTRPRGMPMFALGIAVGGLLAIGAAQLGVRFWRNTEPRRNTELPMPVRDPAAVAAPPPAVAAPPPAVAAVERGVAAPPEPVIPAAPPVGVSFNADPWANIEIDGAAVGETPIAALPLAPGAHRVVARMSDGRVLERRVEIGASKRRIVFP